MPARWADLPKQAATWPAAWGVLVRDMVAQPDFEQQTLRGVAELLKSEPTSTESYRYAEAVVSAALRHHQNVRRGPPYAEAPADAFQTPLADRLAAIRSDWIGQLQKNGADAEALQRAEAWLPFADKASPVRTAILDLWLSQVQKALSKDEFSGARFWMDRVEAHFDRTPGMESAAKGMLLRAETLRDHAQKMPDAAAIRALEDALKIWPRLAEARDALARRQGTYRSVSVAVRALPEQMSPLTAKTTVEKQTLGLLFDRLYEAESDAVLGKRYRLQLATTLPPAIRLRTDVYWSTGERVTASDVRHTALLMDQANAPGRSALWRDLLEMPRVEGNPSQVTLRPRQAMFDPLAPLTFWILPQYHHGKQLQRGDDPDFAQAPTSSGPFQYRGRRTDDGRAYAVFQANPHDLRQPICAVREIRMTTWTDPRKDMPKPLPHLVLDVPTQQRAAFKELGYTETTQKHGGPIHFLAVNHRKPKLGSAAVRRTIGLGVDRQALLNTHFRVEKDKDHATANGLFPRGSWAAAPQVPAELFQPEQARSLAKQAQKDVDKLNFSLKYPADDARVKAACEEIAHAIEAIFQQGGIPCEVNTIALTPHALRKALHERDFDLAYVAADNLDDPIRLAMFLDRQEEATGAGGSNFLGYEGDTKLHELLRSALQYRQFSTLQEKMHAIHTHLHDTMPAIPLWQLDTHVMIHATLKTPGIDPRVVFANVREWKVAP